MVAYPFQKFPSLGKFLDWFRSKGRVTEINNVWGSTYLLEVAETGSYVYLESDIEVLGPDTIKRIEGRLNITTPWHF